jgi:hypothetical protein
MTLFAKMTHAEGTIVLFNRKGISWLSVLVEGTHASSLLEEATLLLLLLKQQLHITQDSLIEYSTAYWYKPGGLLDKKDVLMGKTKVHGQAVLTHTHPSR